MKMVSWKLAGIDDNWQGCQKMKMKNYRITRDALEIAEHKIYGRPKSTAS